MKDTIEVIVYTLGVIGAFTAVIKWAIDKYFKKSEEVAKLKEEINKASINSIEKTMGNVTSEIISMKNSMEELEGHLILFNSRLQDYDKQNNENLKSYIYLSSEIRRKLQIFEGLELHQMKDNTFVFKKKNH